MIIPTHGVHWTEIRWFERQNWWQQHDCVSQRQKNETRVSWIHPQGTLKQIKSLLKKHTNIHMWKKFNRRNTADIRHPHVTRISGLDCCFLLCLILLFLSFPPLHLSSVFCTRQFNLNILCCYHEAASPLYVNMRWETTITSLSATDEDVNTRWHYTHYCSQRACGLVAFCDHLSKWSQIKS